MQSKKTGFCSVGGLFFVVAFLDKKLLSFRQNSGRLEVLRPEYVFSPHMCIGTFFQPWVPQ
jgi:hypothetical protein